MSTTVHISYSCASNVLFNSKSNDYCLISHTQKVDINFDPGVLKFDAQFTVHSSVASIIHELKYKRDMPVFTTPTPKHSPANDINSDNSADSELVQYNACKRNHDDLSKGKIGSAKIMDHDKENVHEENEDACSVRSPTSVDLCSNDSNSSGETNAAPILRQSCGDAGYLADTSTNWSSTTPGMLWNAETPSLVTECEEIPVFELRNDAESPESEKPRRESSACGQSGYIHDNSNQFPTTASLTPAVMLVADGIGHTLEATHTINRSLGSNDTSNSTSTAQSPLARELLEQAEQQQQQQKQQNGDNRHLQRSPHRQLPRQFEQKQVHYWKHDNPQCSLIAESTASLNVITDLEQAFPLMSRFASDSSLTENYYPTPGITLAVPPQTNPTPSSSGTPESGMEYCREGTRSQIHTRHADANNSSFTKAATSGALLSMLPSHLPGIFAPQHAAANIHQSTQTHSHQSSATHPGRCPRERLRLAAARSPKRSVASTTSDTTTKQCPSAQYMNCRDDAPSLDVADKQQKQDTSQISKVTNSQEQTAQESLYRQDVLCGQALTSECCLDSTCNISESTHYSTTFPRTISAGEYHNDEILSLGPSSLVNQHETGTISGGFQNILFSLSSSSEDLHS